MYYTPHIDELYIGFECEKLIDNTWGQYTVDHLNANEDISFYRVKYLNADDIINEGFDFLSETKDFKSFKAIQYEQGEPIMVDIELYNSGAFPLISITKNRVCVLSDLMIKNKNEFRWLMNRIL